MNFFISCSSQYLCVFLCFQLGYTHLSGQENGRINDHISDLEQAVLRCLREEQMSKRLTCNAIKSNWKGDHEYFVRIVKELPENHKKTIHDLTQ